MVAVSLSPRGFRSLCCWVVSDPFMKQKFIGGVVLIAARVGCSIIALLMAGCRDAGENSGEPEKAPPTPQFSAMHGLSLPEATRRSLGLKIVEVSEEKISAKLGLLVRIYDRAGAGARASGFVTPEQAKSLKAGRVVEVRLNDGKTCAGKVVSVNQQLIALGGQVEVLVEFENAEMGFEVGQFLNATVALPSSGSVVTIPRDALLGCIEGRFVYSLSGEHFVRTAVKVGAMSEDRVEITDGLYAGDQVVSQPVMSLWLTELAALKGGQACCIEPPKGK